MLIELKNEANEIDPHRQEKILVNNSTTTLYILAGQDTIMTSGKNRPKRDVVKDILDDAIPPIE